jgi:hypothetical protein
MIYIYTFYTDESRIEYLKNTATIQNVEIQFLKKEHWNGYVDKIIAIDNAIQKHDDNDIICFIDAYDVLINQDIKYLLEKFNDYNCDLIIGAEENCYPEKYKSFYPEIKSYYKYVNSGGYIGYKHAIQKIFRWKSYSEIYNICSDGGDQSFFTEYYLAHFSDKIKIDTECLIFQNMVLLYWNELTFVSGKVYNNILKTSSCFIHFNGGSFLQKNRENIMPCFIEKIKSTLENGGTDNLNAYTQYGGFTVK